MCYYLCQIGDHTKRAEAVLRNADKINCRRFVRAKDIVAGNPKLNLAFVANLFNNFPALELEEGELEEMEPYEETREEKSMLFTDLFVTRKIIICSI